MLATNLRHGLRHPAQAGREEIRINAVSAPLGDVPLFEKIFCINGFGVPPFRWTDSSLS